MFELSERVPFDTVLSDVDGCAELEQSEPSESAQDGMSVFVASEVASLAIGGRLSLDRLAECRQFGCQSGVTEPLRHDKRCDDGGPRIEVGGKLEQAVILLLRR